MQEGFIRHCCAHHSKANLIITRTDNINLNRISWIGVDNVYRQESLHSSIADTY